MSALFLVILLIPFLLAAGTVLLVVLLLRARPATAPPTGALIGVDRRTSAWRWGGVAAGLVIALATAQVDALGRGPMLAAPAFGWCVLLGVVIGESRVGPASGPVRSAALEIRRVRDYLPRGLTWTVAVTAAALLVLAVVTTAVASPDDMGRPGRSLTWQCGDFGGAHGPWPGSFYTVPLAAAVLLGLIAAYISLRAIVTRPRSAADPATLAVDDALRRRAARTVVGAAGLLVALPMTGLVLVAAGGLSAWSRSPCGHGWLHFVASGAGALLIPLLLVVAGWCAGTILAPRAGRSRKPVA